MLPQWAREKSDKNGFLFQSNHGGWKLPCGITTWAHSCHLQPFPGQFLTLARCKSSCWGNSHTNKLLSLLVPQKPLAHLGVTQYSGSGQTHTFEEIKKKEKKISCFLYNLESSCLRLTFSLSEKFPSSSLSVNNGRKRIWTGNVVAHNPPAEQLHHLEAIPGSSRKREKSHTSCREGNPGTETLGDTSTMPYYSTAAGILVGMLFLSL